MNAFLEMAVQEALERAKLRFTSEGYTVEIRPQGSAVPKFLEGYIPDLIARKGEEGVVVAVKPVPPTDSDNKRAVYFADLVKGQPGWRFDLYLARPRQEMLDAPLQPGKAELLAELSIAEKLARDGEVKAALIYSWGLLEAVARLLVLNKWRGEVRRYKPASVISALVSDGYLDDEQGDELSAIAPLRNLIVHGFTKADATPAQVAGLQVIVRSLIDEIPNDGV